MGNAKKVPEVAARLESPTDQWIQSMQGIAVTDSLALTALNVLPEGVDATDQRVIDIRQQILSAAQPKQVAL